ncbi:MAG TPA: carbohydrate porin [Anaeromyxobacteraceae bacterium]|nr:carbohydrate porin [Anaeromyxobacteraceae bacterium]
MHCFRPPLLALVTLSILAAAPALAAEEASAPVAVAVGEPPAALVAPEPPGAPRAAPSWWNATAQTTYVWQRKLGFEAPYSGPKSLSTSAENGYTLTATLMLGARPWSGGELFVNPEVIQSQELSGLVGLAGLSNGEAQKSGGPQATLYRARAFLRQTFALGGEEEAVEPGPNQLGGTAASRRLVVTAGNFSVADVFDGNAYAHDPRTQFLNWTLMAYGASDYAADVRGYTWGVAAEYYADDWALRLGRFAQPRRSNGLALDPDLLAHYGDVLELEHAHQLLGRAGKVRVTGFRNVARMGSFADALAAAAASGGPPDVAGVRRLQSKLALGLGLEQELLPGVGVFARLSANDGRTETYAFAEVERSVSLGVGGTGAAWRRERDRAGVAWVQNELSASHRRYAEAQGAGLFIGDGQLSYRPERILEAFYAAETFRDVWFSVDGQWIANPAYNADRGPVTILGCRIHVEL